MFRFGILLVNFRSMLSAVAKSWLRKRLCYGLGVPARQHEGEGPALICLVRLLFMGGRTRFLRTDMSRFRRVRVGAACLIASASLACTRVPEGTSSGSAGRTGSTVGEDVQGMAKASEKAAKDIGHATVDLGDQARKSLEDATNKAGGEGQDAWITTKVKSELTGVGLDPLHVHVDTDGKVVTLSGTVESAADLRKAVSAAKAVKGVLGVQDRLFVKPAER
jgi:hyperosmotically inducible protein